MPDHSLSIVVPVYNEERQIEASVRDVVRQAREAAWPDAEVIVVDDGSTDGTGVLLDALQIELGLTVIHQPNAGRLRARQAGLDAASGDVVLLIDSRVRLRPGALTFVRDQLAPGASVWNGHVHIQSEGNPYGLFWDVIARAAWSDYFDNPRTTSYGIDDFDRYPKGTTCFLAPRKLVLEANEQFTTYYADPRHANDDTSIIRWIAERERIWLSPSFACDYTPRDSLSKFVRHSYHRGGVFVDGHLRHGSRYAPFIAAVYPLSVVGLLASLRWRRLPAAGLVASAGAAAAIAAAKGEPSSSAARIGAIAPVFAVSYGAGIWRGGVRAAAARWLP